MNEFICGNCKWFKTKRGEKSCEENGVIETARPCALSKKPPGLFEPISIGYNWIEEFKKSSYDSLGIARHVLNEVLRDIEKHQDLMGKSVKFFIQGAERNGTIVDISHEFIHVLVKSSQDSSYLMKIPKTKDTIILITQQDPS